MRDFYFRFKDVYPGKVAVWQSDNGGENLGVFDQQLAKDKIPHSFISPRCPQIDTLVERYHRPVQEELINPHLDTIQDKGVFPRKLSGYLIWDNTQRPHHSLNLKSPWEYFIEKGGISPMSLTFSKTTVIIGK